VRKVGGRAGIALLLPFLAFSPGAITPARATVDVRFLPAYFSGDYGSGIQTEITYLPFILVASGGRQEFRLTVPFISIRSDQPVTFTGGEIVPGNPGGKGGSGAVTESGLGDVIAQDEYDLLQGGAWKPWVSALAWVKIPTADDRRGLGTGEFDYGPGAALTQPIGGGLSLMADARYIVHGTPAGSSSDYRRTWWVSGGLHFRSSARTSVYAFYDDRQSVLQGVEDLRDLSVGFDRRLESGAVLRAAWYQGLSRTAEDYGLSFGVSFGAPR
jgi:hypothetical protein